MKQAVFVLLLFLSLNAFSQSKFFIQANVVTDSKEKISVGDVLLYKNNKIIEYTSVLEGGFSFEALLEGPYLLKILCVGYETYEKKLTLKENKRLEIELKKSSMTLEEITIKATKKVLENRGGNVIANIGVIDKIVAHFR